jgi:hypothetical protein
MHVRVGPCAYVCVRAAVRVSARARARMCVRERVHVLCVRAASEC